MTTPTDPPTSMLRGLNHLTLAVADLDRAFRFYTEVLGCRPVARWTRGAYLIAGDAWLCLELDPARTASSGDDTHVAFSIDAERFEHAKLRLEAAGAASWKQDRSEGRSHYFLDPDGHKLELHVGDLASRIAACRLAPYEGMEIFDEWAEAEPPAVADAAYTYRPARIADIPEMMSIRNTVRENALVSTVLTEDDYVQAMTTEGRAWVCEHDGRVVGFVCGRPVRGDIWALFLRQAHEGRGIGGALMEIVERWMFSEGSDEIWLVTSPGTRAERLYQRRGWVHRGVKPTGEAEYVLRRPG